jgi:hypothetical protein
MSLAEVALNLAECAQGQGANDSAFREIAKSQKLLMTLLRQNPKNVDVRRRCVGLLLQLAELYSQSDKNEQMLEAHDEALGQQRLVVEAMPNSDDEREKLSNMLWNQADRYRAAGNLEAAASLAAERRRRWPTHAVEQYYAAWDLALTAGRVAAGKPELSAAEKSLRDKYLAEALRALEDAVKNGFDDVEQIRQNTAFELLASDPRFIEVLRRRAK